MKFLPRHGFTAAQQETAWSRQGGQCLCCERSLAHVGRGWDAHHRNGERGDERTSNLLLVCVDCHHRCYHDQKDVSRQPGTCRVVRDLCSCAGCRDCTTPYQVCTTKLRRPYATFCSYCAAY